MTYNCPHCGKSISTQLKDTWLVTCTSCHVLVSGEAAVPPDTFFVPDDWSAIQIGTKGTYKNKPFTVTGRARLQMDTDFINLWSAQYPTGPFWIGQSLEKIGFFESAFTPYPEGRYKEPRAGLSIEFSDTVKLKCELTEPCIDLRMEGEIFRLPFSRSNFTFVQASNAQGNTVFVLTDKKQRTEFLWGEIKPIDTLKLTNTRQFNEWK